MQRYEELFEFSPYAHLTLDENGIIVEVNASGVALLNEPRTALVNRPFARLVAPEDAPRLRALLAQCAPDGERTSGEFRLGAAGDERPIELHCEQFAEDGGLYYRVAALDVSERTEAAQQLHDVMLEYQALLHNAFNGVIQVKDQVITRCNRRMEEMFGYGAGELIGQPTDLIHATHASRKAAGDTIYSRIGNGLPYEGEHLMRRKDGATFWCGVMGVPIKASEPGRGAIFRLRDITDVKHAAEALRNAHAELEARVQVRTAELAALTGALQREIEERRRAEEALRTSEERYRRLIEDASDIIYEADAAGRFTFFNTKAMFRLLGYSEQEMLGRRWLEFVRADSREEAAQFYREQAEKRTPETYFELPVVAKDGRELWLGVKVRSESSEDRVMRWRAVCRDVTEARRKEAELEHSRRKLRELSLHLQQAREEERTRIAREVHDELGAALTTIKLDLSWCANSLGADAYSVSKPLGELIRRVDATIETVRRISTSLRPSLLDHLGLWAAIEWQARQFEAAARIPCQLGLDVSEVEPDAERATAAFRIFQEALTNVARHAHATRVEVNARVHEGWLVLEITDDGCGIAEQDPHTTQPLGIFGMHERAQALGGEFELISRPSVGTTAVLRLPLGLDR